MKKNKTKKVNNLTWGLFKCPTRFFKDIGIYFKRIVFLLKHGYSETANWETFNWFIASMSEILENYRWNRTASPCDNAKCEGGCHGKWDKELDRAILLLNQMDELNYEGISVVLQDKYMSLAKNEFFEWFSKNFYRLWD